MEFKEDFLQAVWKYQYFDKNNLKTTDGQPIEIKKIGYHNFFHGPDFLEACIRVGGVDFFGHVEVHRFASDWKNHEHDADSRYNSVILHVVYYNDKPILRKDGSSIPTLELNGKILLDVIRNYEKLVRSDDGIVCGDFLTQIKDIQKFSMLERALVERLESKSERVMEILDETNGNWEETSYRWLFQSFGFKTNALTMYRLSESIPYSYLKKSSHLPQAIEAMLFGQAGFLGELIQDPYTEVLAREYSFYRKKYGLKTVVFPSDWKFMGVRPVNSPVLRLAQLTSFLSKGKNIFSDAIYDFSTLEEFYRLFELRVPEYWKLHFKPGKPSKKALPDRINKNSLKLLAINFVVPLWYSYGKYVEDPIWKDKCFDLLQEIEAESNHITRKFTLYQWSCGNAFDSQGMIGLYNTYCLPKKCMDCKIGQSLLKVRSV